MSKKSNIMVEVDDRVHDLVITPHKKNKTFSKLVATLLSGYLENAYIRGFVEDTLDDMRRASTDALDEIIGNMQEGLANLGIYTQELNNTTQEGMNVFGSRSKQDVSEDIKTQVEEETREIRENMDAIKEQNAKILSVLEMLTGNMQVQQPISQPMMFGMYNGQVINPMATMGSVGNQNTSVGSVTTQIEESKKVKEETSVVESSPKLEMEDEVLDTRTEIESVEVFEEPVEPEEEDLDADVVMANLLGGYNAEF